MFMALLTSRCVGIAQRIQAGLAASRTKSRVQNADMIAEVVAIPAVWFLSRALGTRHDCSSCRERLSPIASFMCGMSYSSSTMIRVARDPGGSSRPAA